MDAYLIKEQIDTLFVLVGGPERGLGGGQGDPPQKVCVPSKKTPESPVIFHVIYFLWSYQENTRKKIMTVMCKFWASGPKYPPNPPS